MIALLFSILSSTVIFVVFKLYGRFKIHTLTAIVFNYITACICGLAAAGKGQWVDTVVSSSWLYYALALGVLFIVVFNLMAVTTQRSGLSVVSVATKMSVVIPILFGLIYYQESLGIIKGMGIVLALVAVYLASIKPSAQLQVKRSHLIYPLLVFLGSGIIDTTIKFLEDRFVGEDEVPIFSATIFMSAALVGGLMLIYLFYFGKLKFQFKNVIGGIALGIPNYFSIYFLVQALRSDILESSGIFTVNNVAIVMLSTLVGISLFKERISIKNWFGILLAIVSIVLITSTGNL